MFIKTRAYTQSHLLDLEDKNIDYNKENFNNRPDIVINTNYIRCIYINNEFNYNTVIMDNEKQYFLDKQDSQDIYDIIEVDNISLKSGL